MKIAVLGSFTTTQLCQFLDLFLFAAGIEADILEGPYGSTRQEILDPGSGLSAFSPSVLIIASDLSDLRDRPSLSSARAEAAQIVERQLAEWRELWSMADARLHCQIIQNNFVLPLQRVLANHEMRMAGSLGSFAAEMNRAFAALAIPGVTIHDVDFLAAAAGRRHWCDPRFAYHAKLPCAPEFLVEYGFNLSSIITAQFGISKKCLALDLDNTLWGGVIGDDGLEGIVLGQGSPEGEAFLAFQQYAKSLSERGVLLAVCSKNDERVARSVFEQHPEMILKLDRISAFVANWDDKTANLPLIAKELNIGTNSMVFVDDNPAEREMVRQFLPEVAVPELPADVAGYIEAVDSGRYFQTVSIGSEDLSRTGFYEANRLREGARQNCASVGDFLKSLEMIGNIEPITTRNLERAAQLINKSNQFNLTTRRRSSAELLELSQNPAWIGWAVSLKDRFGDHGMISVVLARQDASRVVIDTWVMSCRVLKRGLEQFVFNHLLSRAEKLGAAELIGEFIPTAKNGLVTGHFASLRFEKVEQREDGASFWKLKLTAAARPIPNFIQEPQP